MNDYSSLSNPRRPNLPPSIRSSSQPIPQPTPVSGPQDVLSSIPVSQRDTILQALLASQVHGPARSGPGAMPLEYGSYIPRAPPPVTHTPRTFSSEVLPEIVEVGQAEVMSNPDASPERRRSFAKPTRGHSAPDSDAEDFTDELNAIESDEEDDDDESDEDLDWRMSQPPLHY